VLTVFTSLLSCSIAYILWEATRTGHSEL